MCFSLSGCSVQGCPVEVSANPSRFICFSSLWVLRHLSLPLVFCGQCWQELTKEGVTDIPSLMDDSVLEVQTIWVALLIFMNTEIYQLCLLGV